MMGKHSIWWKGASLKAKMGKKTKSDVMTHFTEQKTEVEGALPQSPLLLCNGPNPKTSVALVRL